MVDAEGPKSVRTSSSETRKEKAQRHRERRNLCEDGGRDSVRPPQAKKCQARSHHWVLEEEEAGRVLPEGLWRGHGPADT